MPLKVPLHHTIFPPAEEANKDGVLAYGGDVRPEILLDAYINGIFPWFSGELPLWWHPDPRFILFPKDLRIAKSMRSYFNQEKFSVTYNQEFLQVIHNCRNVGRKNQEGTWITDDLIESFNILHREGFVQSVEVWDEKGVLAGGLYGILLGKIFFGESMFALKANASKFGFISLVQKLQKMGVWLIDCQQETGHLASLGATAVPRKEFLLWIRKNKEMNFM